MQLSEKEIEIINESSHLTNTNLEIEDKKIKKEDLILLLDAMNNIFKNGQEEFYNFAQYVNDNFKPIDVEEQING